MRKNWQLCLFRYFCQRYFWRYFWYPPIDCPTFDFICPCGKKVPARTNWSWRSWSCRMEMDAETILRSRKSFSYLILEIITLKKFRFIVYNIKYNNIYKLYILILVMFTLTCAQIVLLLTCPYVFWNKVCSIN